MKKLILSTILLLPATLGWADIVVYQGSQVVKTVSEAGTRTRVERIIEVVDLDNSQIVVMKMGKGMGGKAFVVGDPTTVVKTTVTKNAGRSEMVMATAGTIVDGVSGVTTVSSLLQKGGIVRGGEGVGDEAKLEVPRLMHGVASVVSTAGTEGVLPAVASALVESKAVLRLQVDVSRELNAAGLDLAAAVEEVKKLRLLKGELEAEELD